jgi:hypothetical protein
MLQKILIILFNDKHLNILENLLKKRALLKESLIVIVPSIETGEYLEKKYSIKCLPTSDFINAQEQEEINQQAILWIHHWSQTKVFDNLSIPEFFRFQNCSLWWISGYLYLYNDILTLIYWVEFLERLHNKYPNCTFMIPDVMGWKSTKSQLSINDHHFYYKILFQYCKLQHLNFKKFDVSLIERFKWVIKLTIERIKVKIFTTIYLPYSEFLRSALVYFYKARQLKKSSDELKKDSIIIQSPSRNWGRLYNLENGISIKGDTKLGYLYQKLKKDLRKDIFGIDVNSFFSGEFKILRDKLKQDYFLNWHSVEYFADLKTRLKAINSKKYFRTKSDFLINQKRFYDSFKYKGINFYTILESRLKFVFRIILPYGSVKKMYFDNLIKKLLPSLFVISYETGLNGRAAIAAATSSGIPVLAIQHGKIHSSHPHYIHLGVSTRQQPKLQYAPIADVTAVFGKQTKEVLTKNSAYPQKLVKIVGQISSDVIPHSNKIYNKKNFVRIHNLKEKQPVICLMSQNFDRKEDYTRFFRTSCESLNEFPYLNFIVKLHPSQEPREIAPIIEKCYKNTQNLRILKDVDLFEVIYCSDVVIIGNSTVGMEALMFQKSLITIEGFKYSMGYAESGASLGVNSVEEMRTSLNAILSDSLTRQNLAENGQKYLTYHLYETDGNVTARVIKIIDQLNERG